MSEKLLEFVSDGLQKTEQALFKLKFDSHHASDATRIYAYVYDMRPKTLNQFISIRLWWYTYIILVPTRTIP